MSWSMVSGFGQNVVSKMVKVSHQSSCGQVVTADDMYQQIYLKWKLKKC